MSWTALRKGSKSFALAARLLPARVGDDAAVVYAFCRRADDAIDAGSDPRAALSALRAEVDEVYAGRAAGPFAEVVARRRIPRAYVDELLEGFAMDAHGASYASLDELLVYCHRVAGTVGLMMCHVMGVRASEALRRAAHLGIAMQLTNICRDVDEDRANGRVYVPPGASVPELLCEAERYYASGDLGVPYLSWRCALAVRTARLVYAEIGRRIRPGGGRAVVPLWRKLTLLGKALWLSVRRPLRAPVVAPAVVLRFPDDVLPL